MINLFVSGFPKDMDEMQLAQLFGPHGHILLLSIARDKFTGKSKGFGFVEMDEDGARQAVAALDGITSGHGLLQVSIATEKKIEPS